MSLSLALVLFFFLYFCVITQECSSVWLPGILRGFVSLAARLRGEMRGATALVECSQLPQEGAEGVVRMTRKEREVCWSVSPFMLSFLCLGFPLRNAFGFSSTCISRQKFANPSGRPGRLEFGEVWLKYTAWSRTALRKLSFSVDGGERVSSFSR